MSYSQLAKTLCPSYYCLYSLFKKIRDKGKRVSPWKRRGREREDRVERKGRGWREGGRNDPNILCTYE
jgi:hypothetical protein